MKHAQRGGFLLWLNNLVVGFLFMNPAYANTMACAKQQKLIWMLVMWHVQLQVIPLAFCQEA